MKTTQQWTHLVGYSLIVVFACTAIVFRVSFAEPLVGSDKLLQIEPECLDFGRALQRSDFKWPLRIRNISKYPISISKFSKSCSCAAVTPESLDIAPGVVATVELTLDLRRGTSEGGFIVEIVPHILGAKPVVVWQVKGEIDQTIVGLPSFIEWGPIDLDRDQPRVRSYSATLSAEATGLELVDASQNVAIQLDRDESKSSTGGSFITGYEVSITLQKKEGLSGPFEETFTLQPVDASHATVGPPQLFVVHGIWPDSLIAIPNAIQFPVIYLGEQHVCRLTLLNTFAENWEGARVRSLRTCDWFSVRELANDNPSRLRVLEIAVKPESTGPFNETITFVLESPSRDGANSSLEISCTGFVTNASLRPTRKDPR